MCKGNHLDKFCFWRHPELIKNPDLRAAQQARIDKYNSAGGAVHNCHAEVKDDESDSGESTYLAYACFRSQCERRCNCDLIFTSRIDETRCHECTEDLSINNPPSISDSMETSEYSHKDATREKNKEKAENRRRMKLLAKTRISVMEPLPAHYSGIRRTTSTVPIVDTTPAAGKYNRSRPLQPKAPLKPERLGVYKAKARKSKPLNLQHSSEFSDHTHEVCAFNGQQCEDNNSNDSSGNWSLWKHTATRQIILRAQGTPTVH